MSRTKARNLRWVGLLAGLLALLALPRLWGSPTIEYAKSTRTFSVCVLLVKSQQVNGADYGSADPYLLPLLDHSSFKPAGWTLDNPLAEGDMDRSKPGYWTATLEARNLDALAAYDLIILDRVAESDLSNADKQLLRGLIDRGATLWVNNARPEGQADYRPLFDPAVVFPRAFPTGTALAGRQTAIDRGHWLLNGTYALSDQDVDALRTSHSPLAFITDGVAGFGPYGSPNSALHEVVRVDNVAYMNDEYKGAYSYAPAVAEGRIGRARVVVTGADVAGAITDWWTARGGNDLEAWPYHPGLSRPGQLPDDCSAYVAGAKFFFNMLGRPQDWPAAGGDGAATRAQARGYAAALTRGWSTPFTTLADPVAYGDYVAVSGNTSGTGVANELRVYRVRRVTGDDGSALDYPYGLYDEHGRQVTKTLLNLPQGQTRPAAWSQFPDDARADSEMDLCFVKSAHGWVGTPIFGQLTQVIGGRSITRTVLYALEVINTSTGWTFRPRCFALDPYIADTPGIPQVAADLWANVPPSASAFTVPLNGLPRASMTMGSGYLVVTTLGVTSAGAPSRIFLVDARAGVVRAWVGASAAWAGQFRLASPARMVTASIDFEASDNEAGVQEIADLVKPGYNPNAPRVRRGQVDLLAATGQILTQGDTDGRPALFLIPPALTVTTRTALSAIPADLTLTDAKGRRYLLNPATARIGGDTEQSRAFRDKFVLATKVSGTTIKVTFRNWNVFLPQGNETDPPLTLPVSLSFFPAGANNESVPESYADVPLTMGQPILLHGALPMPLYDSASKMLTRLTLHQADGDVLLDGAFQRTGGDVFGYRVDAPLLQVGNTLVVGTNAGQSVPPTLQSVGLPLSSRIQGGTLSAIRLRHPGFVEAGVPGASLWSAVPGVLGSAIRVRNPGFVASSVSSVSNWSAVPGTPSIVDTFGDEFAWQFQGDTFGPKPTTSPDEAANNVPTDYAWNGIDPRWWKTDFPFPAAAAKDTVFATGVYHGYGPYAQVLSLGASAQGYTALTQQPPDVARGMLYALDQEPQTYLQQVVGVGRVRNFVAGDPSQLALQPGALIDALRVGARAMLKLGGPEPFNWDMGTVTAIDQDTSPANPGGYWVTFDRPRPAQDLLAPRIADNSAMLLVATTTPYLSHVQAWDTKSGAEVVRKYTIDGKEAVRVSEGISPTADANSPLPSGSEVMIAILGRGETCHDPLGDASRRAVPADRLEATEVAGYETFLPRYLNPARIAAYTVDHRTGRIELAPQVAGELADRFVTVHYATNDLVDGVLTRVPHAEIMHVPSPVRWEYQFTDAVPDSGPVVVGDTVYVTAQRRTNSARWQPALYAFSLAPRNPAQVTPLWVQPLAANVSDSAPLPYRGVTSPVPTPAGLLLGSSLPVRTTGKTYMVASEAEMNALPADHLDVAYRGDLGRWYVYAIFPPPGGNGVPIGLWGEQHFDVAANEAAMLDGDALLHSVGSLVYRSDLGKTFILTATPNTLRANWSELPSNELSFLSDRGLLIADGHRLLRVNADGRLAWQAAGTRDYDPAALTDPNPAIRAAGAVEQAYTLVTHMSPLPNGNILVCDTGANRVVETDRKGNAVWQYPDSDLTYQDPDRANTGTGLRSDALLKTLRTTTPTADRLSGPRDARRYYFDKAIPTTGETVRISWMREGGAAVDLTPYGVTLRWETTLIADTGHNRVIETVRPLVRIENVEALNAAQGVAFASGFHYRPDISYGYLNAANNTWKLGIPCAQVTHELVGGAMELRLDGVTFATPLAMTQALAYLGHDGRLAYACYSSGPTQPDFHDPSQDPVARTGAYIRELLVVVGNAVPDPYVRNQQLRTVRISARMTTTDDPNTYFAVVRNYATVIDDDADGLVKAGTTVLHLDIASEFAIGEEVTLTDKATGAIEKHVVSSVNSEGYTITLTTPLGRDFTADKTRVSFRRANALAMRTDRDDYSRVWQLELVKLRRPTSPATEEVHALVVDQSGVREVVVDPSRQGEPPLFEMTQKEYQSAMRDYAAMINNDPTWKLIADQRLAGLSADELIKRRAQARAWAQDTRFSPVAMIRIDPANGEMPLSSVDALAYQQRVRYLVAQMGTTVSPDPATFINGQGQPRVHLFEVREGNRLVDRNLDYFIYPDPLGAGFPALPGGSYPLSQPLAIAQE